MKASRAQNSFPLFCVVAASPLTIKAFLIDHIKGLARTGKVTILSNFQGKDTSGTWPANVVLAPINILRAISPLRDLVAIWQLWQVFLSVHPKMVFSVTAKTGLLAMIAARMARVPIRVHCFTGQSWVDREGLIRFLLKSADRLIAKLATHLLADSASQRTFLESEGVVPVGRVCVPAHGSISGVDCHRFRPDSKIRQDVRAEMELNEDDRLIVFLARLKRSKGIPELIKAFVAMAATRPRLHLAVIGPDEEQLDPLLYCRVGSVASRLHRVSRFVAEHHRYLIAADVLCLPSHYEGLGTVVIEAAACGVPAVAARVYGLIDAVEDEVTGLLHAVGDVNDLERQLARLVDDDALRHCMGAQARKRAVENFDKDYVVTEYLGYFSRILEESENSSRE